MFASELKAFYKHPKFQKNINLDALSLYFQYGYIHAPYAIFDNTKKLEPGCCLTIQSNGDIQKYQYWNIEDYYIKGANEYACWSKQGLVKTQNDLEQILIDSFNLRLVSDVPVGIFLSGGIDSSLVTAILQKQVNYKLKTFTIGFQDKYFNEANYAKQVAKYLGTDHNELYCIPQDLTNLIDTMACVYDEPFGDSSAIPTLLLSKFVSKHVKVALSADGGDEQFFGYNAYNKYLNVLKFKPFFPIAKQIVKCDKLIRALNTQFGEYKVKKLLTVLNSSSSIDIYSILNKYFLNTDISKLLCNIENITDYTTDYNSIIDSRNQIMLRDIKTYLSDDVLVKTDRASMAFGLESREPLLDNRILEYSAQLPFNYKYKNNCKKYILKNILYKYIPKPLIDRPKTGFGVPIESWFKKDLKPLFLEYLNPNHIKQGKLLNSNYVKLLTDQYYGGKLTNFNNLWLIFNFEKWKEANL
jgi:asparagine synthase (glutamine-hydrolysing)